MVLLSTPDISHIDQLSIIFRNTLVSEIPIERFIEFIRVTKHKTLLMQFFLMFDKYDIDIAYFKDQSYDNILNMSGVYNRLQAKIKQLNSLGDYVPCLAHSLNLDG